MLLSYCHAISVYEIVSERTGYLDLIKENDRITDALIKVRKLDFGINDAWQNPPPTYKGCEPLKTSRKPIKCDQEQNLSE